MAARERLRVALVSLGGGPDNAAIVTDHLRHPLFNAKTGRCLAVLRQLRRVMKPKLGVPDAAPAVETSETLSHPSFSVLSEWSAQLAATQASLDERLRSLIAAEAGVAARECAVRDALASLALARQQADAVIAGRADVERGTADLVHRRRQVEALEAAAAAAARATAVDSREAAALRHEMALTEREAAVGCRM